jgi:hypothetical protein
MTTETTKPTTLDELYLALSADFDKEAYSVDNSRGFDLTSLKAQYIVERLNKTVGFSNWRLDGKFTEKPNGVLFEGALILFLGDFKKLEDGVAAIHQIPTIGYSANKKNTGDVYKGAKTDALSKASSYLGIGNEVFKGNVNLATIKAKGSAKPAAKKTTTKKPETFQGKTPNKASDF